MASFDICPFGAEEGGKGRGRKRSGWKKLGRIHYHIKEMFNHITLSPLL